MVPRQNDNRKLRFTLGRKMSVELGQNKGYECTDGKKTRGVNPEKKLILNGIVHELRLQRRSE